MLFNKIFFLLVLIGSVNGLDSLEFGASYQMISTLGDGDSSIVYLVRNQMGDLLALKSRNSKDLALREFEVSQRLIHPNIIKVYDQFDSYLVMEFIEGKTLRKSVTRCHSCEIARKNVLRFLDALKCAFKERLIHNDLHSSNVMFDQNMDLKLIDLESFSENPNVDYQTNKQYLKIVMGMVMEILFCGEFSEDHLEEVRLKMRSLLIKESYADRMEQLIGQDSFDLFILFLDDLVVQIS